jgi:hypothetical protein
MVELWTPEKQDFYRVVSFHIGIHIYQSIRRGKSIVRFLAFSILLKSERLDKDTRFHPFPWQWPCPFHQTRWIKYFVV